MTTLANPEELTPAQILLTWAARIGGPLVALVVYFLLHYGSTLSQEACITGGIAMWMAVWWMTEAVPLAVTSLLPIPLFPLFGVTDIKVVSSHYGNEYIFLFMGGFMIALAIEKCNLHRRVALTIISVSGTQANTLVGGFMLATAAISMWISNTATTVMMLPVAASVAGLLVGKQDEDSNQDANRFGVCLMLGIAYASSIGGLATLVGTPPNNALAGIAGEHGLQIDFARWMMLGFPLSVVFLVIAWIVLTFFVFPLRNIHLADSTEWLTNQREELGSISRAEKLVAVVFCLVAAGWLTQDWLKNWKWLVEHLPLLKNLSDTVIAIGGAILLFVIPVSLRKREFLLDWPTARRLPWGVLLIYGGGFAIAKAVKDHGLDVWIGNQFIGFEFLPPILLMAIVTLVVVFLTEMTSNTATAFALIPILFAVEAQLELPPLTLVLPATLAASCAFMLPAATPPNAIVIGSNLVKIRHMVKGGFWLNLVAVFLITFFCWMMGSVVLPPK